MKGKKVVIIGGGPGGYTAAFKAAELGLEVFLIDLEEGLGGVCLLRGCIPSKALLHAAKVISEAREAKIMGIDFQEPRIDQDKLKGWKNGVVEGLKEGLEQLCRARKIKHIRGRAEFLSSEKARVEKAGGGVEEISFDYAIIASGSLPHQLPLIPDSPRVLYSSSALDMERIPKRLLVIGAGYIGLELGTVYRELGSEITVVEIGASILPGVDQDLSSVLYKRLQARFSSIRLNTKVTEVVADEAGDSISVTLEGSKGEKTTEKYDHILVAVGRKPNTLGLALDKTGAELTKDGFIKVDENMMTTDARLYAIGDVAGQPMLAHKAMHEGDRVAALIAGKKGVPAFPRAIPAVVFTDPEIAWCGLTEAQALKDSMKIKVAKFSWKASGRAAALNRRDGVTKLILDQKTGRVLGAGFVGDGCGELISEAVLAIEMGAVAEDLALTVHPHPTLSETVMEAAKSADIGYSA